MICRSSKNHFILQTDVYSCEMFDGKTREKVKDFLLSPPPNTFYNIIKTHVNLIGISKTHNEEPWANLKRMIRILKRANKLYLTKIFTSLRVITYLNISEKLT